MCNNNNDNNNNNNYNNNYNNNNNTGSKPLFTSEVSLRGGLTLRLFILRQHDGVRMDVHMSDNTLVSQILEFGSVYC